MRVATTGPPHPPRPRSELRRREAEASDEATTSLLGDDASGAGTPGLTPYAGLTGFSAGALTAFSRGYLPDLLGIENLMVESQRVRARVPVRRDLMAPHGYLHGGTLVSVAPPLV